MARKAKPEPTYEEQIAAHNKWVEENNIAMARYNKAMEARNAKIEVIPGGHVEPIAGPLSDTES